MMHLSIDIKTISIR